MGQVLYGTYIIPDDADQPIDIIINPIGDEVRRTRRFVTAAVIEMTALAWRPSGVGPETLHAHFLRSRADSWSYLLGARTTSL